MFLDRLIARSICLNRFLPKRNAVSGIISLFHTRQIIHHACFVSIHIYPKIKFN